VCGDGDGIVLGTPICQAAYSGLLKTLARSTAKAGVGRKTVLPVATAGNVARLPAIDYGLCPVPGALGALGTDRIRPGRLLLYECIAEDLGGRTVVTPAARVMIESAVTDVGSALMGGVMAV
jgi:FMN reductase